MPLRLELGPKDLAAAQAVLTRRDLSQKITLSLDSLAEKIPQLLEQIQTDLFQKALKFQREKTVEVESWPEFCQEIENGNFVVANYDGSREVEKKIKEELKATVRCIPFAFGEKKITGKCVYSQGEAKIRAIFARSY